MGGALARKASDSPPTAFSIGDLTELEAMEMGPLAFAAGRGSGRSSRTSTSDAIRNSGVIEVASNRVAPDGAGGRP
jgi:hypothetical protein